MNIRKINKDQLKQCTFTRAIGYSTNCEKREQSRKLHLSMLLSGIHENNVRIVFNTIDGYKEVLAGIWGATEKFILLQGGPFIPVDSVVYVTLE